MGSSRVTATRAARTRLGVAALAAAGGLLAIGAGFLPWISTATEDGGSTQISGWGSITGSSGIAGTNLNDVLDGADSYRPGLLGLVFGVITLIAAVAIAAVPGATRPHRITASVLSLAGLACAGWGVFRGVNAGDAGVFQPGDVSAAFGPWLTAIGGLLVIAAAVVIFAGFIDPPAPPVRRRGIQPR